VKTIADEMLEHPFFHELSEDYVRLMGDCGENTIYRAGALIAAEGAAANHFFVLRAGRVALELHAAASGSVCIQTLDAGDVLGWSWLFPPYRWSFDARAVQDVRAICIDGECLRGKCDEDPAMGYALMQRFSRLMIQRVESARLQLLDFYAQAGDA
jgi:CRP/FNR family cyclic AMP-dependent transcriptional regulator